jgi:hypothetical protein
MVMLEWIYGVPKASGNEKILVETYEEHSRQVKEYFRKRPDDLLILRVAEGEGWETLCRFLDKPVPTASFPHRNKALDRRRMDRLGPLAPVYRVMLNFARRVKLSPLGVRLGLSRRARGRDRS